MAESFAYDGLGRRIEGKVYYGGTYVCAHRDYYYNTAWQILETHSYDDEDPLKLYVWCLRHIDSPVVRFYDCDSPPGPDGDYLDANDSILFYTTDANFNITALVRADTGRVAERYEYDPYGFVTILNGDPGTAESPGDKGGTGITEWAANAPQWSDWENLILFAGYQWDLFGCYYARNRYYHPTLGAWLTRDPIGPAPPEARQGRQGACGRQAGQVDFSVTGGRRRQPVAAGGKARQAAATIGQPGAATAASGSAARGAMIGGGRSRTGRPASRCRPVCCIARRGLWGNSSSCASPTVVSVAAAAAVAAGTPAARSSVGCAPAGGYRPPDRR